MKTIKCFKCGVFGHFQKTCAKAASVAASQLAVGYAGAIPAGYEDEYYAEHAEVDSLEAVFAEHGITVTSEDRFGEDDEYDYDGPYECAAEEYDANDVHYGNNKKNQSQYLNW